MVCFVKLENRKGLRIPSLTRSIWWFKTRNWIISYAVPFLASSPTGKIKGLNFYLMDLSLIF